MSAPGIRYVIAMPWCEALAGRALWSINLLMLVSRQLTSDWLQGTSGVRFNRVIKLLSWSCIINAFINYWE